MVASSGALVLSLVAAVCDLLWRRIPNWLTVPAFLLGLAWHIVQGTWREALLGLLLAVVIYLPLWLVGGRGAGDLKLMAALGTWLGPAAWIQVFVLTALIGGLWALVLVIAKRRVIATIKNIFGILRSLVTGRKPAHRLGSAGAIAVPHGAIVALAMLAWIAVMRPT
jgi:prepilin peptidase CpaA